MADSIDILKIRREEAERELARLLAHVRSVTSSRSRGYGEGGKSRCCGSSRRD